MSINIPSIKRADPVQQGSIGRDQTQAPSAEPYIKNLNTISSVFEKGADLAFKYEKQAQDLQLRDLTNQYKAALYGTGDEKESWTVTRFQKSPKEGQDFTQAFAGYQDYKQSLRDKVMSTASGGVSKRLKTELADVDFYADRSVNVEFYKANNVRKDKVYNASIDLIKQVDIPAAVGAYNPKDPDTVKHLAMTFTKIADQSKEHGLSLGFKEGDPLLQSMMREDVGEAVVKSINDALSIKDTDKATQIWMQFQEIVPNKKAEPLKAKIADIVIDKEIDTWANKYTGLSEEVGLAKIRKEAPEQLQKDIEEKYIKLMTRKSEQLGRISEGYKNTVANDFLQRRQNGNAPLTLKEVNSEYGAELKNMNVGDKQYIYNLVGARTKSGDPVNYEKIIDKFERNDPTVKSWGIEDVMRNTVNFSTKEYNSVISAWEKRNDWSADHGKVMRILKSSTKRYQVEIDKTFDYTSGQEDVWDNKIRTWLTSEIEKLPKEMTQSEIEDESKKLKKQVFKKLSDIKAKELKQDDAFKFSTTTLPAKQKEQQIIAPTDPIDKIKSQFKSAPGKGTN